MPRVEIVQKHNTAARRLYIRGHNGKVCAETTQLLIAFTSVVIKETSQRIFRTKTTICLMENFANYCLKKVNSKRKVMYENMSNSKVGSNIYFFLSLGVSILGGQ